MQYLPNQIERTIDNLFANAHDVEDAGYITAARHMRNAADMLQSALDAKTWQDFEVKHHDDAF
jgi:hypothetical protein